MKARKNTWNSIVLIAIFATFFTMPALAEDFRIWTAINGQTIEAKYVQHKEGKIVLKTVDGKTIEISPNKLSETDQKFANKQIPPKLKLDFKKKTSTKNHSYDDTLVKMDCRITIKRTSQNPYSGTLKVEVFVLGEDLRKRNIVILKTKTWNNILLPESRTKEAELKLDTIELDFDDEGYKYGKDYHGYAVFVFTEEGKLIASKASRKSYAEKLYLLRDGKLDSF